MILKRLLLASVIVATLESVAPAPAARAQILLVANQTTGTVGQFDAITGGAINTSFVTGLSAPQSVTLDNSGNLYTASITNNRVGKYNAATGATINSSFITVSQADFVAIGPSGNLYVGSGNLGSVGVYDPITGAAINGSFITGLGDVGGLVFDGLGHLFVSRVAFSTGIGEYDALTGVLINPNFITVPSTTLPFHMVIDGNNHFFVAHSGLAAGVAEYDATTGAAINPNFITGLASPIGIALDGNGHMFVSDQSASRVGVYDATTGSVINANFIPSGLSGPTGLVVQAVPEPGSLALVGCAVFVVGSGWYRRRRAGTSAAAVMPSASARCRAIRMVGVL